MTNAISENQAHCKHIADTLAQIAENSVYKCPECGVSSGTMTNITQRMRHIPAPHCSKTIDESDLEALSMLDYFQDSYNIEYRVNAKGEYQSVQVMVAYGGSNIYVDTKTAAVELYWWGDRAEWGLTSDAVAAIDAAFEELSECGRS